MQDLKRKIRFLTKMFGTKVDGKKRSVYMSCLIEVEIRIGRGEKRSENNTFVQSHRRDIIIKNSINSVQHKVLKLGHSHSWGSVVKLRTELSAK
jgi:hypothetical protein